MCRNSIDAVDDDDEDEASSIPSDEEGEGVFLFCFSHYCLVKEVVNVCCCREVSPLSELTVHTVSGLMSVGTLLIWYTFFHVADVHRAGRTFLIT